MQNAQKINVSISTSTVFKILAIFIAAFLVYFISDILLIFFISLIFASAFNPWVDWLQQRKVPRSIGILSVYLVFIFMVSMIFFLIIPPIAKQIGDLSHNFPRYLNSLQSSLNSIKGYSGGSNILDGINSSLSSVSDNLQNNAWGIFDWIKNIFGGVLSFFLVFVITFYMAVEESAMSKIVISLAPLKHQPYILHLIGRMQKKIGLWLRGQLILCLAVGVLTFIGLLILNVKYALVLAMIATFTEFIPYLGPVIGAVPAVFLAFAQSPALGLVVAVFYYFVQLTENHILVPKVMQKTAGLNPIVSIAVLMIGFKLAGVAGAILSIPVATAASVLIEDIFENRFGEIGSEEESEIF
jgi:predicted PurR-regulated permease PerM